MAAKRYWIIGMAIDGIYYPRLDIVSKEDTESGTVAYMDYDKCLADCNKMQKVRDKKDADSKE